MNAKLPCLAMGLLLLAACTTTKVLHEWRSPDGANTRFGHLMMVALFRQDQARRMFEDEFALQTSSLGQMVVRSYLLVPVLDESTTERLATIAKGVGADGILLVRMLSSRQAPETADGNAPAAPMNLPEFLSRAWKDNYDPPDPMTNAVMTMESRLYDVKSGKLVWSLATESKNQLGAAWEINLLARRVLDKINAATPTK